MARSFQERLQHPPILCDGAMGTELYALGGYPFDHCLDELNLSHPQLVKEIHLDYIQAGAEIIETNTFGANRVRLAAHSLQSSVGEINHQGVAIAQEARRLTGQMVWIAGAVGPLGKRIAPLGPIPVRQAREAFHEQISALTQAGVDLIVLETFTDLQELQDAVQAAREECSLPIIAQMTLTEEGRTLEGVTPTEIVRALEALKVQVIGLNCSVGPQVMLEAIREMVQVSTVPITAQPNAGFPGYVGGRFVYFSSPDYMAEHARAMVEAGVTIIGGCCGTTPHHIASIRDGIKGASPLHPHPPSRTGVRASSPTPPVAAPPPPPTNLEKKLGQEFVVTVEVDPPKGFDLSQVLQQLADLRSTGLVDAINVADSPRAQGRMSALVMANLIQTRLGMETILHLATRHRNLVALHSELLGAHALGIRNIFSVMGDLPRMGDYPDATAVSDITASGLVHLMKCFNQGCDLTGKPIEQPTAFFMGCAFNMAAPDPDRELLVLERKLKAGANFLLTQSVFTPDLVEYWWHRLGGFPAPVLLGVLPLRNHRHAEFLHHEVPGIVIPTEVRERIRDAGDKAPEVGITIARELIEAARSRIAGVYFIPPFGRYETVAQVVKGLVELVPDSAAFESSPGQGTADQ